MSQHIPFQFGGDKETPKPTPWWRTLMSYVLLWLGGFVLLAGLLYVLVTQPLLGVSPGTEKTGQASPRILSDTVHHIVYQLPERSEDPDKLDAVANYIYKRFQQYKDATIYEQVFEVKGWEYKNVIARFGPIGNGRIVIGAHYDSEQGKPGADDNAGGVAGLLELARLLGQTELGIEVELVAYALEEPPYFRTEHMGSAHHARALREQGVDVRLMLALEMIGYFSDEPGSQSYPIEPIKWLYPDTGHFIAVVGDLKNMLETRRVKAAMTGAGPLPVYSINAPALIPGVDFSDHLNYWYEGFPALMITDTAFYRNPAYHTKQDLPEQLDYERMALVVDGVMAVVREYGGGE